MFDTILGLPMHPLVIHAVVVLVPLMALVTVVVAVRKEWRERLAWPVAVVNGGLFGLSLVAKESGEALQRRLGVDVEDHERWGSLLPWLVLALLAASLVVAAARRNSRIGPPAVLFAILAAAAVTFWTVRTGHTGAEAVWST